MSKFIYSPLYLSATQTQIMPNRPSNSKSEVKKAPNLVLILFDTHKTTFLFVSLKQHFLSFEAATYPHTLIIFPGVSLLSRVRVFHPKCLI